MKVITVKTGVIKTNTYILFNDGSKDAIVVDPGDETHKIEATLNEYGVQAKAMLITHAHFDHVNAVADFQAKGAIAYLHNEDVELIYSKESSFKSMRAQIVPFEPDILISDEQELNVCGIKVKVLHTPGHSKGSVCYIIGDIIFSGDTLFYQDIGSTKFYGGSEDSLLNSINNKLFMLEHDYQVLPGHGIPTTLKFEKENNPYV